MFTVLFYFFLRDRVYYFSLNLGKPYHPIFAGYICFCILCVFVIAIVFFFLMDPRKDAVSPANVDT